MGGKQAKEADAPPRDEAKPRVSLVHRGLRSLPSYDLGDPLKVETLDVSHNKLTDTFFSAEGIGRYANLQTLVADDNRLGSVLNMPDMPKLRFFSANSNNFTDVDLLCQLLSAKCPALHTLSLVNNPCWPSYEHQAKTPSSLSVYRAAALRHLPKLKLLDCVEVTSRERQVAEKLDQDVRDGDVDLDQALKFDDAPPVRLGSTAVLKPKPKPAPKEGPKAAKQKKEKKSKKEKKEKKDKKRRRRRGSGTPSAPPKGPSELEKWESSDGSDGPDSDAELETVLRESRATMRHSNASIVPPPPPPPGPGGQVSASLALIPATSRPPLPAAAASAALIQAPTQLTRPPPPPVDVPPPPPPPPPVDDATPPRAESPGWTSDGSDTSE